MDDYSLRQKKVFTNWINHKLESVEGVVVNDLFVDLADGFALYHLLEILEEKDLHSLRLLNKGKMRIHKINNMNIVWKFLTQTVKIVGIGPNDVVDGHPTLILGLIWSIIVFFFAKDFGGLDDMGKIKSRTLNWLRKRTEHIPDLKVNNLTSDLGDGRVLLAVLNGANPMLSPYNPSNDSRTNLHMAFDQANELYDIPKLLDADDPGCCSDEKAVLPYLAEWMKKIPDKAPNPLEDSLDALKNDEKSIEDSLQELASIPSVVTNKNTFQPAIDATTAIVKFLNNIKNKKDHDNGEDKNDDDGNNNNNDNNNDGNNDITNPNIDDNGNVYGNNNGNESKNLKIKVIVPDSDNVDPSECRAPIVIGETQNDTNDGNNKPTLLLVTSYGTDDPSKHGEASLWTNDPFNPVLTDKTITAKGVACDKANVIAAVEAIKVLVSAFGNKLPIKLKILAAGLPPSSISDPMMNNNKSSSDNDNNNNNENDNNNNNENDINNNGENIEHPTKRLANFIEQHKEEILTPNVDVILASKPGSFTKQFPNDIITIFSGRGKLAFDLTIQSTNSTPICPSECLNSNSNPIFALSSILSKLIEQNKNNTIFNFGFEKEESKSNDIEQEQEQEKEQTEFDKLLSCPELNAEFSKMFPADQSQNSSPLLKRLFSEATIVPMNILSSSNNDSNKNKDQNNNNYVPVTANCSLNVFLPSKCNIDNALNSIQTFIEDELKQINTNMTVSFSNVEKINGWLCDPTSNVFSQLVQSLKSSFEGNNRHLVPCCEPSSSPFCSNLVQAFNGVPTFFISLNDSKSNINGPNETVAFDDISGMTEALIRFAFSMGTGTSSTPNSNPNPTPNPTPNSDSNQNQNKRNNKPISSKMNTQPTHQNVSTKQEPKQVIQGEIAPSTSNKNNRTNPNDQEVQDLFVELNEMRSDPCAYANKIANLIDAFEQRDENDTNFTIFNPSNGVRMQTHEGRVAFEEVLNTLRSTSSLPLFEQFQGMNDAARDLIIDQQISGMTGHQASDGSNSCDRLSRYGQWFYVSGEVLVYVQPTAILRVIQLLCSDGDESRYTRTSLLNPEFKACGISIGTHPKFQRIAVVTLTGRYGPKPLDVATVATYSSESKTKSENFDRVMDSIPIPIPIPIPQIHEHVEGKNH